MGFLSEEVALEDFELRVLEKLFELDELELLSDSRV